MSTTNARLFRYLPKDPEPGLFNSLGDAMHRWPLFGRIGYCAEGADWRDAYVLVVPVERAQLSWDVLVRGICRETGAEEVVDEWLETEPVRSFLADNPVKWAPPALDGLIEARVFGWRAVERRVALKRGVLCYTLGGLRFDPASEAERVEADLWPKGAGEDAPHSGHND